MMPNWSLKTIILSENCGNDDVLLDSFIYKIGSQNCPKIQKANQNYTKAMCGLSHS
jgi:hypothetical protein